MKLILSRKGFDSGSGGGASPILNDRPVPVPIPTGYRSRTRYCDLEIGQLVEQIKNGGVFPDSMANDLLCFGATEQILAVDAAAERPGVWLADKIQDLQYHPARN